MSGTLDAYLENGADINDLRFDDRDLRPLTGTMAFRLSVPSLPPNRAEVRLEWQQWSFPPFGIFAGCR